MKKQTEKKRYCAPVIKVVTFQLESGFAGSVRPWETPSNLQAENWRYNNSSDNISGSFGRWQ